MSVNKKILQKAAAKYIEYWYHLWPGQGQDDLQTKCTIEHYLSDGSNWDTLTRGTRDLILQYYLFGTMDIDENEGDNYRLCHGAPAYIISRK